MKALLVLFFITLHSYADVEELFWEKVYEHEWDRVSDIMRWYWGGYNANIPVKSFHGDDFLMSDKEINDFCKEHVRGACPLVKSKQYVIYKLHELPSESSQVNGYRAVVIHADKGKSTFNESAPYFTFVKGEELDPAPDNHQTFAEELKIYLPVLEYIPPKSKAVYEWIRIPSMGKKVNLWMSSRNTPGFAKDIIGKKDLFWWEGLVRLSDLRVIFRNECFVKIGKGKIYFKGLLFLPGLNQDFNNTKFEDYPGFQGRKERLDALASYLKEVSGYPDFVFEEDLRKYFFSRELSHLGKRKISSFELLEYPIGRNCDNKFVLKDMPIKKRREIYTKYYDSFWHFSFFGRAQPDDYFTGLDKQKEPVGLSDVYYMDKK